MAVLYYNLQNKDLGPTPEDVSANWPWAVVSYLGLLFLIPLMIKKDSRFAVYHAKQSAIIFSAAVLWLLAWFMFGKLAPQSEFTFLLLTGIGLFGVIMIFLSWLSGILNAFRKEMKLALFLDWIM